MRSLGTNGAGVGLRARKSPREAGFVVSTGAGDRNRTYDPIITNDVLYQLSYCGGNRGVARVTPASTGALLTLWPRLGKARAGPEPPSRS